MARLGWLEFDDANIKASPTKLTIPMFEAIKLDAEAIETHEEQIRQRIRQMDDASRKNYYDRFSKEMKDPDTYAVLNFFFVTGLHHMYLGKYFRGAVNLCILLLGIVCFILGLVIIGGAAVLFILCVELMALFRSQMIVADYNNHVSERILKSMLY